MGVDMKFLKTLILSLSICSFASAQLPEDGRVDIWPSIPFTRGADLCRYSDAYGQTRSEYMMQMTRLASYFYMNAVGSLTQFNELYDRNLNLAVQGQYLDVTLESTLKAYVDSYYRNLRPKIKKISFTSANDVVAALRANAPVNESALASIDYVAYGTYTLAPSCQGDIQVTLHMTGKNGETESYVGMGKPEVVMSQIASEIFTQFQRTQFPSEVKVGNTMLTLVGGFNGSVAKASSPKMAFDSCATLEARLPELQELEILDGYGDWSGGVSLNDKVWAFGDGLIYAAHLRPMPVREAFEVNAKEFFYYCVK